MNSQSSTGSESTVDDMLKAIMQLLDAIKEMLRPLQPIQSLEERVTVLEEKVLEEEADVKQLVGRLEARSALVEEV
ncbi:hypothetical protein GUJ93_ZPchr0002g26022 [Zizania palustris]|uniref:Uncharacterized protein n=1 Tax=Zizania palustris TaxID=103762 RepID=A0A8J5RTT5_ZIZPA|nr:hypothetical protein GUJ93_ZPchr0002g26022 [Zizania palustris]